MHRNAETHARRVPTAMCLRMGCAVFQALFAKASSKVQATPLFGQVQPSEIHTPLTNEFDPKMDCESLFRVCQGYLNITLPEFSSVFVTGLETAQEYEFIDDTARTQEHLSED